MASGRDWSAEVATLCDLVEAHYLDDEVADRVKELLRRRLTGGSYQHARDERAFAESVSTDTVAASGDLHLRLRYSRISLPERDDRIVPESGRDPKEAALTGHGFARVERLPGNVGLIDIRRFWPLSMSRHAAIGAMHLIADTDALIIDLRSSAGGEPEMVSFLCSYLFEDRVHLNDLYFPAADETIEWWTDPSVPGPRFGAEKPVFVLIGITTMSAAEELCYDLQQQGRADLIGETTAGAANFDYRYRVGEHLMFSVPSGYPINPVSGRGWEGTGVEPDVTVDPRHAFDHAYACALDHVIALGDGNGRTSVFEEAAEARRRLEGTRRSP